MGKVDMASRIDRYSHFLHLFCSAKILYVSGRLFPVDSYFTQEPQADYLDASLVTIFQIHVKNPKGDILMFLPGKEIFDGRKMGP
jgi:HrpA-like RNA helicase